AGALAAHIEVEPQFIPAIEAALGQNLQAVILKDAMVAEHIVKTLTGRKMGRASLAIKDFRFQISDFRLEDQLPEGAVGWAIDKVRADDQIQPLIAQLLRRVAIVPNVETAFRLRSNLQSEICNLQFVTLTGEVLTAEGILTGGATGEAVNSVLERKNQIAALEVDAAAIRSAIHETTVRRDEFS